MSKKNIKIKEVKNLRNLYDYQMGLTSPYMFSVDFDDWKKSMYDDVDGEGCKLFKNVTVKAAYDGDTIVGYIQYGNTAIGFDESGEISNDVTYPVIRMLYFDEDYEEAGQALLEKALSKLDHTNRIYAFFHYFGMSCYARHGKLFEKYTHVEDVLKKYGFVVEHENIYYSSEICTMGDFDVDIIWHDQTKGNQQTGDFIFENNCIGECEVHYIGNKEISYLRWIYINDNIQNQGIGTKCMRCLKDSLYKKGFSKLDTDTAINNIRAQHYYEKNHFIREGITRSFYKDFV